MNSNTADAALQLDLEGRIASDLPCRHCAYNLRGLTLDGVCPECARPVGQSLGHNYLRNCDPDWVSGLAMGLNIIIGAVLLGILGGCALGGATVALGRGVRPGGGATILMQSLQYLVAILSFVGYWKLTSPDPGRTEPESDYSARRIVRIAQVAGLGLMLLALMATAISPTVQTILALISSPIGIVTMIAILIYGRQIAMRIPNERLAWHIRVVTWGGGISMAATTLGGMTMMISSLGTAAAAPGALTTTGYLAPVGGPGANTNAAPNMPAAPSAPGPEGVDSDDANTDVAPTAPGSIRGGQVMPRSSRSSLPVATAPAGMPAPTGMPPGFGAGMPRAGILGTMFGGAFVACSAMALGVFALWALVLVLWMRSELLKAAEAARLNAASLSPPPMPGGAF
jgi:hypothetical protein